MQCLCRHMARLEAISMPPAHNKFISYIALYTRIIKKCEVKKGSRD